MTSRTRILLSAIAVLCLLSPSPPAWAGAWTVPRRRWYTEYFYRYFGSKDEFDARRNSSRRAKSASFRDFRHEVKLEYGLTDTWNLLASAPYQSSHYQDSNGDLLTTGVGDIYVRSKLRLLTEPLVGSLQTSVKIPSAYNPAESPALGDGQVDVETRFQVSRALTYWPYEAPVRRSAPAVHAPRAQDPPQRADAPRASVTPVTREDAMRRALLVSELYERGRRLHMAGQTDEAVMWLRAALDTDPRHTEARRLLELTAPPGELWVGSAEAAEPRPRLDSAGQDDMETRYAGVAFVNFESGLNLRNEEPANEVPLVLEAGFTPLKRLMLVGTHESVFSIKSTHEHPEEFSKLGLRAIVNVWGDGFASVFRDGSPTVNVEVGYNDIYAGRNTADAFEVFTKLGIFF